MGANRIFSLDLGTSKFCFGMLSQQSDDNWDWDSVSVPSKGMKRGNVADAQAVREGLIHLLECAERHFQTDVSRVVLGIPGTHLHVRRLTHRHEMAEQEITSTVLQDIYQAARQTTKRARHEILLLHPLRYTINGLEQIAEPTGLKARVVEAEFFVVDAEESILRNLIHLCNQSGLEVQNCYPESFAAALIAVPNEARRLGVALIDIGGGTSDGVVFLRGAPSAVFGVNIGGALMTHDIAIGLNLSAEEAERVKTCIGLRQDGNAHLVVTDLYGKEREISSREVFPILASRVIELAKLIVEKLKPYKGQLGSGILLTGGGSEMTGLCSFLEKVLKVPVRKASPRLVLDGKVSGKDGASADLATSLGLLSLEWQQIAREHSRKGGLLSHPYVHQFLTWIKELS